MFPGVQGVGRRQVPDALSKKYKGSGPEQKLQRILTFASSIQPAED